MNAFEPLNEAKVKPPRTWFQRTFSPMTIGSVRASIYTVCASVIGAGELTLPLALSSCGIVVGLFLLISLGCLFTYYYLLLAKVCHSENLYDYIALVEKFYGPKGRFATEVCIVMACYGVISAYMILILQMIVSFLRTISVLDDSHDVIISTVIPVTCLLCIWIPASLPREITALRYGSTCCIIGMLYIIIVLIAQAPAYMARQDFSEVEYIKLDRNIFSVIGICLFSYCGGQNIPSIYNELLLRSPSRIKKVILRGMTTIILFYCSMALIGYLTTLHDTPELIVFRSPISGTKDQDWPMVLARLTVIVYLNMNMPMNLYPTRMCLERILFNTHPPGMIKHGLLTTIILSSNLLIALLLPDALFFFRIVGSFGAMAICITIPAMLYYRISSNMCEKAYVIIGCACVWALGCSCIVDTVLSAV